jgi:hypothetical protein
MGKRYWSETECCIICGCQGVDLHHVKSRGAGGSDLDYNLMPLAHKYHQELHTIGLNTMSIKYPQVEDWLHKNGWEYEPYAERWVHELE